MVGLLLLTGELFTLLALLDDDVVWNCTTPSVLPGAVVVLLGGIVWNCATPRVLAGAFVVCLVCEELVKVVLGT